MTLSTLRCTGAELHEEPGTTELIGDEDRAKAREIYQRDRCPKRRRRCGSWAVKCTRSSSMTQGFESLHEKPTPAHYRPRRRPAGLLGRTFSTWPPNSKRMAESSLSAKSASPRELKRS